MKAVLLNGFGGSEVLQIQDIPEPTLQAEQLLIRVHAAGLNRADILQRKGKYPPPVGESEILGLEIAGEVVACGNATTGFAVGDRVFGLVSGGGYAEYCVIDYAMAIPIPTHWTYAQAAAIPEAFFTAHETLFELGRLTAGNSVLIHAGGSGIGTAGIQMARYSNTKIYITAGSEAKIAKALQLGATAGINYKTQDFADELQHLTRGQGVDVIQDFIGANYLSRNLISLKPSGRLIQVALLSGAKTEIDLSMLIRKRLQIKGFVMRPQSLAEKRQITSRFRERWLPVLSAGEIHPIIDSEFILEQVQQAHQYMEANLNFGKIILHII